MARSGFGVRFRYVQWLLHLVEGFPPDYAEIARGVGGAVGQKPPSGQIVSAWSKRDEAPDTRENMRGLAKYLGVAEDWLIDGAGKPPRPELWEFWSAARAAQRDSAPAMAQPPAAVAKTAAGKKRKVK